ncbi:MAG TPA: hypothetical protein VL283_01555 [Candidatus Baltobacteraceae bacterium]|nr:hypothetical protein [Candidatus Baltobacteraceae bacterium]
MPKKILIVEDETSLLEAYRARIVVDGLPLDVSTAETLVDAVCAIEEDGPFEAIVVDGCFPHHAGADHLPEPGRACNGEKFVLWLRGSRVGYAGPIIACSSISEFNDKMVAAGATRAAVKGYGVIDALAALFPPTPAVK